MEPQKPKVNYGHGTVPPEPWRARQGEDKTLWIFAGVVVLAVLLIVLSRVSFGGTIETGEVDAYDCFDYPDDRARRVKLRSCAEDHAGQAFTVIPVIASSTGRIECQDRWERAFADFVELPAGTEIKALKRYNPFDHTTVYSGKVLCVVANRDGLEGSIQDR